jgi:hypothetical protein
MFARSEKRYGCLLAMGAAVALTCGAVSGGQCPADLDDDGEVGVLDLLDILAAWGSDPGGPPDFDGSGDVGLLDLVFLLASWGPCPSEPLPGDVELFDTTFVVDVTDQDAESEGLIVTQVYATGDQVQVGDALLLSGNAVISGQNATFFQHLAGSALPPDSSDFPMNPLLRYDTFFAMNLLEDDANTLLTPGSSMDASQLIGGWFVAPGTVQREAVDIGDITGTPGQAGVLIAQITIAPGAGAVLSGYGGTVRLFTSSLDGGSLEGIEVGVTFSHDDCPADLDDDGGVGVLDLLDILAAWGSDPGGPPDFDGSGDVGLLDLVFLLASWGPCPSEPLPGTEELFDGAIAIDVTDEAAAQLGLIVTHLYATGNQLQVGDALLVVGDANIAPQNAPFFQHFAGGALPPESSMVDQFPELAYDTFFAMNLLEDDTNTMLTPGSSMDTSQLIGGWFVAPGTVQREAVNISGVTGIPGQAGVLIAQITLVAGASAVTEAYGGTIQMFTSSVDGGSLEGVEVDIHFPCPWDTGGDGDVGVVDFLVLLSLWGACPGCLPDHTGDDTVDVRDFLQLLAHWGPCP